MSLRVLSLNILCPAVAIALVLPAGAWARTASWQGKGGNVRQRRRQRTRSRRLGRDAVVAGPPAARGLQDDVPLYYTPPGLGEQPRASGRRWRDAYEQMSESALTGGRMFGFTRTRFVAAADDPEIAYQGAER